MGRRRSLFKRNTQISLPADDYRSVRPVDNVIASDSQRTRDRYLEATRRLQGAINAVGRRWGRFDIPEILGEPEEFNDESFQSRINAVLNARRPTITNEHVWAKCRRTLLCVLTAMSPFAKNLLQIAQDSGSSASHSSILSDCAVMQPLRTTLWRSPSFNTGTDFPAI